MLRSLTALSPARQRRNGLGSSASLVLRSLPRERREVYMIKLAGIGHVLLRVADEEASKRFYRDVLGFRVAEQDPEHGGVFMTLGDGFHSLDITQHPAPADAA